MTYLLSNDTYDDLVAALVAVEPCPFTGTVSTNEITWTLAGFGVFPVRSENDPAAVDAPGA